MARPELTTAVVDATVPTDWSPRFIGCQVWSGGRWVELLDVWIEDGEDRDCWISRRRTVRDSTGTRVEACAQNTHVQDVPAELCSHRLLEEGISVWDWNTPPGPPPPLPVRPAGWAPPAAPPQLLDVTLTTDPRGDELALFTL